MCPNLAISGWEAPREPKKIKGRRGAGQERDAAGTHCARSGPARSPPPHLRGCAGSSWRGRGGPRCTGDAGGWPRPSHSARAAPRPRGRGGPRLRPARGRPGPRRGPQRTGSAWHFPRAPAAGVREAIGARCETACRGGGGSRSPRDSRAPLVRCCSDGAAPRGRRPYIARLTLPAGGCPRHRVFLIGIASGPRPRTHPLTPRLRPQPPLWPAPG